MVSTSGWRWLVLLGLAAVTSSAMAHEHSQTSRNEPPATEPVANPALPAGTVIHAQLMTAIDSHHSNPGDTFFARVVTPVYDSAGQTVIPAGSQLIGTVQVAERGRPFARHAPLAYGIHSVNINGTSVPIVATITQAAEYSRRGGIWLRPEQNVPVGSNLTVQLGASVPIASLLRAGGNRAIGGGPQY